MSFRDKINNTINNASNNEAQRKQEIIMQEVNGVCDWVRKRIEAKAAHHTNPNIPFKVNMYFACHISEAYITHSETQPGRSYNSPTVNKLTLSEDILTQEKLIRDQLKSDGIIVGKWKLYDAYVAYGDNVTPRPNYSCYYARAFGVYEADEIQNATLINIDPYKPITNTTRKIWCTPTYTYTYSQGGNSIRCTPSQLYLIMPISFS